MHEIYELKEMLCKELEEYGRKGEMSAGTLEIVDKLAHAVKNLGKIIEMDEEAEYSGAGGSYNYSYRDNMRGGSYARGGNRGGSYARGRGANARRDSMGRYSSEGYSRAEDAADAIRSVMDDLPEDVRRDAHRLIKKIEENG